MIEFLLGKISGDDLNLVRVYMYESTVRPDSITDRKGSHFYKPRGTGPTLKYKTPLSWSSIEHAFFMYGCCIEVVQESQVL